MPVLHKSLDTSNKIARRGENPDEAAIEATALHGIADILQVKTRNLRLDKNAFDAQDWLGKVALVLNSGDVERAADGDDDEIDRPNAEARAAEGWLKVGMMAMRHSLRVPAIDFMCAAFALAVRST